MKHNSEREKCLKFIHNKEINTYVTELECKELERFEEEEEDELVHSDNIEHSDTDPDIEIMACTKN